MPLPGSRRPAPRPPAPRFLRTAVAAVLVLLLYLAAALKSARGAVRGSAGHAPTLLGAAVALTASAGVGAFGGDAPTLLGAAAGLAGWAALARLTASDRAAS